MNMMQRGYKAAGLRCPAAQPSLRARKGLSCRCEAAATVQRDAAPSQAGIHSSTQPRTTRTLGPAPHAPLAYELVQGNLVRFSGDAAKKTVPTAVLVHGILGSRRNLHNFAELIVKGFPTWQVMLVDLRCHGESAVAAGQAYTPGPHTVDSAAQDILGLLRQLKMFPNMLVGHSFGGKVVMSMAQQFGARLPRPVQVWVLDTLPGEVRAGGPQRQDHPSDLIRVLQNLPMPLFSRSQLLDYLSAHGFSMPVARWMTTNLRPAAPGVHTSTPSSSSNNGSGALTGLHWSFDLDGISEMYRSYETSTLWPLLHAPPEGLLVDFVRAEHSTFRWEGPEQDLIQQLGHRVHMLPHAGHWVHTDNPVGLFDLMSHTFGGRVDLGMQHKPAFSRR